MNRQFRYSSSSSDSDDSVIVKYITRRRRITNIRVDKYLLDETVFLSQYRIGKDTANFICRMIQRQMQSSTDRNNALKVSEQLLIALRFYATASIQAIVGEANGTHKATVCRAIHRVSRALASLAPMYIYMPRNEEEMAQVSYEFYRIAKFPKVIAAVDCTQIPIQSPGGNNPELYRCRKGYFSLNVQTCVDARLKIRDIVCRWPGSTHDTTIFNNSSIKDRVENGEFGQRYFLGDGGYPQLLYLMTPFRAPASTSQNLYNKYHIRTRNTVERSYGVWKRRFPCLGLKLRVSRSKMEAIIVATAVLHNICRDRNEPDIEYPEFPNEDDNVTPLENNCTTGNIARNNLVRDFFSRNDSEE